MSTREEREAAAEAAEDRATWEENHYAKPSFRESVIADRCVEAGYPR